MQAQSVTNALFVPAMLGFMARVPDAEKRQFPALRSIIYGASPITNETLLAAMRVFKCEFVQVYGMTETTGAITELGAADHDPAGAKAHLLRSAGKPFPWVELRVVDIEGRDCRAGQVGELWTRSGAKHARLLEEARRDSSDHHCGRVVEDWRCRLHGRKRVCVPNRPGERHDHIRGREHLSG
jgi:acyl-CoA synthetase (AMP-forming)/AMP-acid ligase II